MMEDFRDRQPTKAGILSESGISGDGYVMLTLTLVWPIELHPHLYSLPALHVYHNQAFERLKVHSETRHLVCHFYVLRRLGRCLKK